MNALRSKTRVPSLIGRHLDNNWIPYKYLVNRIKTINVSATNAQSTIQQCGCGGKVQNKDVQDYREKEDLLQLFCRASFCCSIGASLAQTTTTLHWPTVNLNIVT